MEPRVVAVRGTGLRKSSRPAGFGPARRLTRAADYQRIFRRRAGQHGRYFSMYIATNPSATARLGLAVSKKASRAAVRRNRIKRVIREAFRQTAARLNFDCIVVAKPTADRATNADLRRELERLMRRAAARLPA